MAGRPLDGVAVAQCVADIEVSDFIALDFEFSGLFVDNEREEWPLSLEAYYQKCAQSIPWFLPLQLGVCCARRQADAGGVWELRPHEFNLWPRDRRTFMSDLQSLRFLRAHGFDFNAFFERAHSYSRLPAPDAAARKPAQAVGVMQVLDALRKAQVPLVFHNGLLDILHLYDKFLGDLPDTVEELCKAWVAAFPVTFDTRLVAQEGRHKLLMHSGGLSLEALHRHLSGVPGIAVRSARAGAFGEDRPAHGSSGQDAALTAEVFLMEVDLWVRSDGPDREARKRPRGAAAEAPPAPQAEDGGDGAGAAAGGTQADGAAEGDGGWMVAGHKRPRAAAAGHPAVTPSLLVGHKACRQFHNRIAIVGASRGSLDLGPPQGLPPVS